MIRYTIADMTCGNCVRHITQAVHTVAPDARVEADLAQHQLRIEGGADEAVVRAAIVEAGYTPAPLAG